VVEMLKCSRCIGDGSHRFAVEHKVPTTDRVGNEHLVAAATPHLPSSICSLVRGPHTNLTTAGAGR
jgi:hypothetical protein